jgi:enamine deaminase RidA (YjgF/YER057c/UK114 family)
MSNLSEEQGTFARETNLAIHALEHKVEKLKREIGTKPEALLTEYNAPTMWGSIGALGLQLDTMGQNIQDPTKKVAQEVKRAVEPFKTQVLEAVSTKMVSLETWINKIKTFVLKMTKHLQQCIDEHFKDADLNGVTVAFSVKLSAASGASQNKSNKSKPDGWKM